MNRGSGSVAQGRAYTRLAQEERARYRQIYADAPSDLRGSRQNWAKAELVRECPERYRELYLEEMASLTTGGESEVDPDVVGKSSGPGPWHAVLSDRSATLCGRIRFIVHPASAIQRVECTYCIDELAEKTGRQADPRFGEYAAATDAWVVEFAELSRRAMDARNALLDSLSVLRTPPKGSKERDTFAALLARALDLGLTLKDIGESLNLTGERVRQIVAERAP